MTEEVSVQLELTNDQLSVLTGKLQGDTEPGCQIHPITTETNFYISTLFTKTNNAEIGLILHNIA